MSRLCHRLWDFLSHWWAVVSVLRKGKPEDKEELKQRYFEAGTHYYAAARFVALQNANSVSGNLFHIAMEMYLKGHLCADLNQAQRKALGHMLKRLWKKYKKTLLDPSLGQYDAAIARLHKFEGIRYPEDIVERGMIVDCSFGALGAMTRSGSPPPQYTLEIPPLDRLVAVLFQKASVNPNIIRGYLSEHELKFLRQYNPTNTWN